MSASTNPSREERLAAKLRENLRRRKAQARVLGGAGKDGDDRSGTGGESAPPLPKEGPSR